VPDTQDPSTGSSKAIAILVYTLLRVGLFALVWVVIEFLTPLHGLWAAAAAILISGAISVVVLDRQRGEVGAAAAGFFGRINARIEASAAAEDDDGDDASGESQEQPQHKAVDQE
jgi:hypothetical protein